MTGGAEDGVGDGGGSARRGRARGDGGGETATGGWIWSGWLDGRPWATADGPDGSDAGGRRGGGGRGCGWSGCGSDDGLSDSGSADGGGLFQPFGRFHGPAEKGR